MRETIEVVQSADRTHVMHPFGALAVRELTVAFAGRTANVVVVHHAQQQLAWWAPLRPGETSQHVAERLTLSGGRIADITIANGPPRIVIRDVAARASNLDEARAHVTSADPALLDPDRAYREISLVPYIDRSFYELEGAALQPVVAPRKSEYRDGRWIVSVVSSYRDQTADIVLDENYKVVDVRRNQ